MNYLVDSIRKSTWLATFVAVILGVAIMLLSSLAAKPTIALLNQYFSLNFYTSNVVGKFFMLVISLLVILIVNKGSLKGYGFTSSNNTRYLPLTLKSGGIFILSMLGGSILFIGILGTLFPTGNTTSFPEQKSIIQMVLTIWVWSSICEEVMVRGFVQSFISNSQQVKFLKLSLPVWVSGLFFGAMHLTLLRGGMGQWFVAFIVFNTTVIGLVTAYYREKSNSIIPAIWLHFFANFIGSIPLIIKLLLN